MIVGGYTLDLYCGVEGCEETLTVGAVETGGEARRFARALDWTVKLTENECYCPKHRQSGKDRI